MDRLSTLKRWQFKTAAWLPFLRGTADRMEITRDERIKGLGTDGFEIFYCAENSHVTEADYQHMMIHCLFAHMAVRIGNRQIRDLACDMSAEYLRADIFAPEGAAGIKRLVTGALPESCDPASAASVARSLMELQDDEFEELARSFRRDDHRYWYESPPAHQNRRREKLLASFRRKSRI